MVTGSAGGNQHGGTSWSFGLGNNGGAGSNGNSGGSSWSWRGNSGNTGKNSWSWGYPHHLENDEAPSSNNNKHHPQHIKIIINSKKTKIGVQAKKSQAKA